MESGVGLQDTGCRGCIDQSEHANYILFCRQQYRLGVQSTQPHFPEHQRTKRQPRKNEDKKIATNLKRNKETTQETRLDVRRTLT